tara:strand:+ start:55590 stop:56069 length:480 start_codon:yes stop_codon:yes gene_type:complete
MSSLVHSYITNDVDELDEDDEIYYQTCINLLVISKLQVDDLLDTRKKSFELLRPSQSWIPLSLYRYWFSQNRRDNVVALQRLFFNVNKIDSGQMQKLRLDNEQKVRLKKLVSKARKGLKKLQETYSKDVQTTARIHYLFEDSEKNTLEKYKEKHNNTKI